MEEAWPGLHGESDRPTAGSGGKIEERKSIKECENTVNVCIQQNVACAKTCIVEIDGKDFT